MDGEVSPAGGAGELRASHADRDRVVELLRVAAGDGRITADELDQRLEAALTARTLGELAVLTTDLPASAARGASVPAGPPKDLVTIDCGSGVAKRDGPWVVPRRMEVRVTTGVVRLDFTEATITSPELRIDADVSSGVLALLTRPGIEVDLDDVRTATGIASVQRSDGPAAAVILRIVVTGRVGSGVIRAMPPRPPRRTFWQWLLRRPPIRPALPG
jgi:Domain of unknown function (DUF1707)